MPSKDYERSLVFKRIQQIRYSNEILDHGVAELEVLYLRIQSGDVQDEAEARKNAVILNEKNYRLATSIKKGLKASESYLKQEMELGGDVKNVVHEFVTVLRESIRILNNYRMIQESYHNNSNKETRFSSEYRQFVKVFRANAFMQRILKSLCTCGFTTELTS